MNFFPISYNNELLYSVLARYCIRSGNIKNIHNLEDIFGKRSCIAVFEFASNLDMLIKNLPIGSKYSSDYFIYNNTIFPLYVHFISKELADDIKEEMRGERGDKVYIKLGLIANSLKVNEYMMFCPECLMENMNIYGEAYWDRLHQIPGVQVCYKHKILLQKSTILIRGGNRQKFIPQTLENCIVYNENNISKEILEKMIWMAEDIEKLFAFDSTFNTDIIKKFREKLIEKGYARLNNYTNFKKLRNDFSEFYTDEYLNLIQSSVIHKERSWLTDIFYNKNRTNPIRYLLLSRFLGISVEELIENKIDIIKDESDFKNIWEQNIIELAKKGKSIREISKEIHSSTKTIRKVFDKLNINMTYSWRGGGKYTQIEYINTKEFLDLRNKKRVLWLELLKNNPGKSNNKLREIDKTTYRWLSKYDKDWLKENSSKFVTPKKRIDWNKRDEELIDNVKKIVNEMKSDKPERITWTNVGNKLGINGWFVKRKNNLPKTKEFLDGEIESIQDFQIRKINWAVKKLKEQGKEITLWNLVELSGVKEKYIKNLTIDIDELKLRS